MAEPNRVPSDDNARVSLTCTVSHILSDLTWRRSRLETAKTVRVRGLRGCFCGAVDRGRRAMERDVLERAAGGRVDKQMGPVRHATCRCAVARTRLAPVDPTSRIAAGACMIGLLTLQNIYRIGSASYR